MAQRKTTDSFRSIKHKSSIVIHPSRTAVVAGLIYILSAGLYIIISTQYVASHAVSLDDFFRSEMLKGLLFVWVTGLLLTLSFWIMSSRIAHQAEKIVEQRNALLISERQAIAGMLASSAAHDINNILATINLSLHLLEHPDTHDQSHTDKHVDYIRKACSQLSDLTRRFMEAGRNQTRSTAARYSMDTIIQESLEFSKSHSDVRFCTFLTECPPNVQMVGYPDLVQQMFFNLILNAGQATQGKGRILIRVTPHEDMVTLVVEDNGPGIPPEQRGQIFQPFFTTKPNGNGLGMLSILACVEAHGGDIGIEAVETGGARFRVKLPRYLETESDRLET